MPHKIYHVDTQQGTSAAWLPRRLEERFEPAILVNDYKIAGPVLAQKVHYDLLILDSAADTSDGIQKIAQRATFVMQPTNPALENLEPAVRLFHELIRSGIPKARIVFALNHVLTDSG
jgi:chromosome partitioning protein